MRRTKHNLLGGGVKTLKAKLEIPSQKGLMAVYHLSGDDKVRVIKRFKHVAENFLYRLNALNFVEGVFEARLLTVKGFQLNQILRLQGLKEINRRTNEKYAR